MGILAQIQDPQSGVLLCHCVDHILHSASSHGFIMGSQTSVLVSFSKDLEHGYRVLPSSEIWVHIMFQAERIPMGPMVLQWIGTLCGNSSLDPIVDSAQVKAECIGLRD
jgi:hypothetical protein